MILLSQNIIELGLTLNTVGVPDISLVHAELAAKTEVCEIKNKKTNIFVIL
jgi:hypothetical protein